MNSQLKLAVGQELRSIRKEASLNIEEIALKTGIASSTISQYENGKRNMNLDTIYKIVSACGNDMNIFFKKCIAKMQQEE